MSTVLSTPSVKHHSLHHASILTSGVPTPDVLLEFEDACEDFFANAKGGVNDDVKVIRILPSFKDPILRGWISSDRPHLSTLTFGAFMKLLRSKFLSKQWEDELLSKVLRDHLCPGKDFLTWATKLQQQNCILRNTDSQLDEKRLREQISMRVDMDLRIAAREAKVNEATSLRDFLDIYTLCDEKRRSSENRTRSIFNESYQKKNKENSYHPYKRDSRSSTPAAQTSGSLSSHPPKLSPIEIEILKGCFGCFKCCKLFQSKEHITTEASKKTCEFPSGDNYRPLTWEFANKIKALREARKASSSKKLIAATTAPTSSLQNSSSIIEVDSSNENNFVASMFGPLATSAMIGNETFSSEGDLSVCQPFKSKHYIWKCMIDGILDEFPLKISTLIDNGAHMVLICPDTVKKLGLSTFPLPEPEEVDVVISSSHSTK